MGKVRMIDTRFWDDVWVTDRLNPLDRYLMLYFLTNSKTNVAGVYEISLKTVANETGIDKDEIIKMVSRLAPRVRYLDGWVVIQNFIKHQNYKNESIRKGIEICLEMAPPDLLRYVSCPKDWIPAVVKRETENLQIDFDESPMTYIRDRGNSNLNSNSNFNINTNNSTNVELAEKPVYGKPEINELFDYWQERVGYKIDARVTANRRAASNMLKKHGYDKLKQLIDGVALAQDDKFAPRISDFAQLQQKLSDLLVWGKQLQNSGNDKVAIIS